MTKSLHRHCTFKTVLERKRRRSGFSAENRRREEKAQKWRAVADCSRHEQRRIKFRRLVQNGMSTAVMWSKSKPGVEFQYGGRLGEFHGMSSQSHLSHCRMLPLGEFTVTIPEPDATLQGVRIPSAILKIVLRHFFIFWFLIQFRLWQAAAFVSSPIYLLYFTRVYWQYRLMCHVICRRSNVCNTLE